MSRQNIDIEKIILFEITFFVLKWGGKLELAKVLMHYLNVKRNV
jgi:hypothetical protein